MDRRPVDVVPLMVERRSWSTVKIKVWPFWKIVSIKVYPVILIVFNNPMLEVWPGLYGKEDIPTYWARIFGSACRIEPDSNASGTYFVVAWEADFPLDNSTPGAKRATFCEADDAAFATAGLYAVLDSKQVAQERLCHCGKLQNLSLARLNIWFVLFLNRRFVEVV